MQRPTGVTVLAILDFIGAAFWVLLAIIGFFGAALLGAFISRMADRGAMGAGVGAVVGIGIGIFALIGGGIAALLGWGMWSLKEWARILQIVFAGIGACFQALLSLIALAHFRVFMLIWHLIFFAVNAVIIWYLIQPQVKAAFAAPPVAGFAPPVPPAPPAAGA